MKLLNLVLCYHHVDDRAFWLTVSEAQRLKASDGNVDILPDLAVNYAVVAAMAGPKPERFVDEG